MSRPRNNIALLCREARERVCELLDDGETYDVIRRDPVVEAECKRRNLLLHNASFGAYQSGAEYREFCRARSTQALDIASRKAAAAAIRVDDHEEDLGAVARFELMKLLLDRLSDGSELEIKELQAIASSINAANNQARELTFQRKLDAKEAEILELGKQIETLKLEHAAEILKLQERIAELSGSKRSGLSPEALEQAEKKLAML